MIKVPCLNCGHIIEALDEMSGQTVKCPACPSSQIIRSAAGSPAVFFPAESRSCPAWPAIQRTGETFAGLSGLLVVVSIGGVVAGIALNNIIPLIVAGSAFGLALWLYQSAQFLHIRALLEKSSNPPPAPPEKPS